MNETYQNRITDQICKIQNDRALIAFYDRLRYAPLGNYAQLHANCLLYTSPSPRD